MKCEQNFGRIALEDALFFCIARLAEFIGRGAVQALKSSTETREIDCRSYSTQRQIVCGSTTVSLLQ